MTLTIENLGGISFPEVFPYIQKARTNNVDKNNTLVIATPHNGIIDPNCAASREALIMHVVKMRDVIPVYFRNCNIARARNDLFEYAYKIRADILFIDSDMEFSTSDYDILVNAEKDVVSALCFKRKFPYTPCAFNFTNHRRQAAIKTIHKQIFQADACGMAFCLIRNNIIRLMTSSYITKMLGKPFNHLQDNFEDQLEEDISFCMRLNIINIPVWVIPNTSVLHAGRGYLDFINYNKEETNKIDLSN